MKLTSIAYRAGISTISALPLGLRKALYKAIRFSGIPNNKFYKDLRYEGGLSVRVNEKEFFMNSSGGTIENELFWKGIYHAFESETIWFFEELIKRNITTIIDIGANTGLYSLFAYTLNPKLNIIAFEPSRKTFLKLKSNVEANGFNIKMEKIALSNTNGTAVFYDVLDENQTNASLSSKMLKDNPHMNVKMDEYTVDVITFDEYCSKFEITGIDFIKIDVELHEPEVLEGMLGTIQKEFPYLMFEVLTDEVAEKVQKIIERLRGYGLYELVNDQENGHYIRPIEVFTITHNYDWNYLACHESKIDQIKELIR